jgi:phosphate transport system substrate-binding protein
MFIEEELLGGSRITEKAEGVPVFLTMMQKISLTPDAIGYARIRDIYESQPESKLEVKVLKIRKDANSPAVAPSRKTILDGSYPIRRPYYLYTTARSSEDVRLLVDFIASKGLREPIPGKVYIWQ